VPIWLLLLLFGHSASIALYHLRPLSQSQCGHRPFASKQLTRKGESRGEVCLTLDYLLLFPHTPTTTTYLPPQHFQHRATSPDHTFTSFHTIWHASYAQESICLSSIALICSRFVTAASLSADILLCCLPFGSDRVSSTLHFSATTSAKKTLHVLSIRPIFFPKPSYHSPRSVPSPSSQYRPSHTTILGHGARLHWIKSSLCLALFSSARPFLLQFVFYTTAFRPSQLIDKTANGR